MKKRSPQLLQILSIVALASMLVFSQAKPDPKTVLFRVSVVDKKGNILENLKKEQFTLKDEGTEQEISYFSDKDEPASVVILLDLSESIVPRLQNLNIKYALRFIRESNLENEYSIIAFNKEIQEIVDWKDDRERMAEKLNKISSEENLTGNTRLYDAMLTAFEKFKTAGHNKKILFVLSDGEDNQSEESFGKVKKELKKNDVAVYSICIADYGSVMAMQGQAFLENLAAISGGKIYFPQTVVESEEVLGRMISVMTKQYVIGYIPKESPKKKDWHSVKIKVAVADEKGKEKSLVVTTREGYFAAETKPE